MDRAVAWEELNLRVESPNVLRHSLAVEAVMRRLAEQLEENPDTWGLAGLLHDIDAERVRRLPSQKGHMAGEILRNLETDPVIVHAVEASVSGTGKPGRRAIDKALIVANAVADLIIGAALECPEKRLAVLTVDLLLRRHEAGGASCRERTEAVARCTELGLTPHATYGLALAAMMAVSEPLGL